MAQQDFAKRPSIVAIVYGAGSVVWIFLTDLALRHANLSHATGTAISIAKGSVFVVITALFIYYLLRRASSDREKFRSLLESAPDAMVIVDGSGVITLVNAQAERLFLYRRSELIGQPVECLLPERYRVEHPSLREKFSRGQEARPMHRGIELFGRRRDGSEFPAEISLSPIKTTDGIVICSDVRDISERKLAEEQIKKLNTELERALLRSDKLAVTGKLLATLAHEINNPLESLGNLLYLLRRDPSLGESGKEIVEAAEREASRLATISRQTLAPHREATLPVVTRISELLDDAVAVFQRQLESANIQVIREYENVGELSVYPSELRQVFTNLITNAIDAMSPGGELCLSIERSPAAEIIVRIRDTGCGIPAENIASIFEPFFTTKGEEGSGIGLWVIKGIVERMAGRIEVVSSTTGKTGTCFSLFFPKTAVAHEAQKFKTTSQRTVS